MYLIHTVLQHDIVLVFLESPLLSLTSKPDFFFSKQKTHLQRGAPSY